MRREVERDRWATFLDEFTGRNLRRTTRLQISGQVGAPLIEGDIPLTRIALEIEGSGAPHVEITLRGGGRRVLRRLPLVHEITLLTRPDGSDESLEVVSEGGVRALLCFEFPTDVTAA